MLVGAKMYDFRRMTLFCLEKRLSKDKMTIFPNIWGAMAPLVPLATPMSGMLNICSHRKIHFNKKT